MRNFALAILILCGLVATPAWCQTMVPPPNARVHRTQPNIQVTFTSPVRSPRIWIDGQEFTAQARLDGNTLTLVPPYPLDQGVHKVTAEAMNLLGIPERANWSFTIATAPAQPEQPPAGASGAPTSTVPAAGTVIEAVRPELAAIFPESIRSARMMLDGADLSGRTRVQTTRVMAVPTKDLQPGHHTAQVEATGMSGRQYSGVWEFEVAAKAPAAQLLNLNPPPGASVSMPRPFISADFPVEVRHARLYLDNTDYSSQLKLTPKRVTWTPPFDLPPGQHTVRVESSHRGQPLQADWNFVVEAPAPPAGETGDTSDLTVNLPNAGDLVGPRFNVEGQASPGATLRISVRAEKGKPSHFKGKADRAGNFSIPVDAKSAPKGSRLWVEVVVIDARSGEKLTDPYGFHLRRR